MDQRTAFIPVVSLAICSCACGEISVSRYEDVRQARADTLFDRGWVPDVLPEEAGPLIEAHNIDTNVMCASARFAPAAFETIRAALSREGFEPYHGPLPHRPLHVCPFDDDACLRASIVLKRSESGGYSAYAGLGKDGTFLFMEGP